MYPYAPQNRPILKPDDQLDLTETVSYFELVFMLCLYDTNKILGIKRGNYTDSYGK